MHHFNVNKEIIFGEMDSLEEETEDVAVNNDNSTLPKQERYVNYLKSCVKTSKIINFRIRLAMESVKNESSCGSAAASSVLQILQFFLFRILL